MKSKILYLFTFGLALLPLTSASATTFFASGQLLIENTPGTHDDVRENYLFEVDTLTGVATPVSPVTSGLPAALGGGADNTLYGYKGSLGSIEPQTGTFTPIGADTGISATAFEVLNNLGYLLSFSDDKLYSIDLQNGTPGEIGSGLNLDQDLGDLFIISLGAVGDKLYGVNLGTGTNNLIEIDPLTADAVLIGELDAVSKPGYSGFSALTGVDEDADGQYDALFGNVNFYNGDRLGGIVRYDLQSGTWTMVGTNPGVIFFGFGQPVPEPGSMALLGAGVLAAWRKRRGVCSRSD